MELAFLPEEAEYTDSTERVLVASVISVTQNQLFLWILPTYPGTAEVTETANSAVSVTSAASTAHLVEIAIEYAFLGQKSSFWPIFLNRMRKFAQNFN